jgi:hypothetical protein
MKYQIFADEAWTHGGNPLRRYWCFLGGVFGLQPDLDRFDSELRKIIRHHGIQSEVKWSNLRANNLACFKDLADCLFHNLANDNLKYRQTFLDRRNVWIPSRGEIPLSDLEVQYRIYYQFLKHAFGLRHLPNPSGSPVKIQVNLDDHSSKTEKARLVQFAEQLPAHLDRADLDISVGYLNSSKNTLLQVSDLVMAAAGSHGNKMQQKRVPGKRGMTPKQRLRDELCAHVYNGFRKLDALKRSTKAFNWFETTGHDGDRANRFHHALRIWKFVPRNHIIDLGWENDRLDARGNYQGRELSTTMQR